MKRKLAKIVPAIAALAPMIARADWTSGFALANSSALPGGTVVNIITQLMMWLLLLLGAIAIIGFVISGIWYLTAAGDEERMERGKRGMMYSIIGVIVALIGFVIVQAVNTWLGGQNADF